MDHPDSLRSIGGALPTEWDQRQSAQRRFILERCYRAGVQPNDFLAWLRTMPYSVEDGWYAYMRAGCPTQA